MALQLYIASETFEAPPVITEEDEMLDFQDIGGVYDDPSTATASNNTAVLNAFLANEAASDGISLVFSGNKNPAYNNKRTPGTAYFRLISSSIANVATAGAHADVNFIGLPGTKLVGLESQTSTTPLMILTRRQATSQQIRLTNLHIENKTGAGIKLVGTQAGQGPGQRVILSNCLFEDIGTSLPAQSFDYDGWTDIDTVPYAIYIDEADGCMLSNISIDKVNGHGIITTRWHAGMGHVGIRECQGSGLKGQEINGTPLQLRAETNKGWGMHVRDCGTERWLSTGAASEEGTANAWEVWFEANNARESTSHPFGTSLGYAFRQARVESSARVTLGGHSGWSDNKIDLDESVRRSCRLIESDFIDPSVDGVKVSLIYDMNNDGVSDATSATFSNWVAQWPDVSYRPSVATLGDTLDGTLEAVITIPVACYDNVATPAQGAWWKIQPSTFLPTTGDILLYSAQVSGNIEAYSYCIDREALAGGNRMPSWLGSFNLWGPDRALTTYALWNEGKRRLCNRIYMEDVTDTQMITYVYIPGMGDAASTGTEFPTGEATIRIHDLKIYKLLA